MLPPPPNQQIPGGIPPPPQQPLAGSPQQFQTTNEELIEAIIDEKWNDLVKDINKIIEWKNTADTRLASMDQQIKDLRNEFDKLHQAVIGKVGEYDQHILDVGAELKAMEKVFAKVLPVFTENVSELSRITDTMKQH
ncbi:hypothetical protein K9M74_03435 [Candidatus Woesearchaeota archaeon]|nr:hypothetical protein [Candidatus Woesearchaeota archaeon]